MHRLTSSHACLQIRVTAARPGVVNFELDIQKEHTVRSNPSRPSAWTEPNRTDICSRTDLTFSMAGQSPAWVRFSHFIPNTTAPDKSCSRPRRLSSRGIPRPFRNRRLYRPQRNLSLLRREDRRPDQSRSVMRQVYAAFSSIIS